MAACLIVPYENYDMGARRYFYKGGKICGLGIT